MRHEACKRKNLGKVKPPGENISYQPPVDFGRVSGRRPAMFVRLFTREYLIVALLTMSCRKACASSQAGRLLAHGSKSHIKDSRFDQS